MSLKQMPHSRGWPRVISKHVLRQQFILLSLESRPCVRLAIRRRIYINHLPLSDPSDCVDASFAAMVHDVIIKVRKNPQIQISENLDDRLKQIRFTRAILAY